MKNPLNYTYDGLERELNLLEIHLKEAPKGDKAFCQDCIDKHISTARGFSLEGPGFTSDRAEQEKFLETEKQLRKIKGQDYKKKGVELSQKVRQIRKDLYDECPECEEEFGEKKLQIMKKITKSLNSPITFNNQELNGKPKKMVTYAELGMMNAGQFAAEGVRYLVDTQKPEWADYVSIGGGVGLQALGLFVRGIPTWAKTLMLISGSNLLANGVVKLVKPAPVVGVRAAAVRASPKAGYAGKSYATSNGRTFAGKVTATKIPSQYARAGILSGAQAFESPEHADLIRVD